MLISSTKLSHFMNLSSLRNRMVLQIGAHAAEEHELWASLGFNQFHYVEPLPQMSELLEKRFQDEKNVFVHSLVVSRTSEKVQFIEGYPTYISSIKRLTEYTKLQNPELVELKTHLIQAVSLDKILRDIIKETPELLVLDIQGAELEILEHSIDFVQSRFVIVELLYANLYEDQCDAKMVKDFMNSRNFKLVEEEFDVSGKWSDALFILNEI